MDGRPADGRRRGGLVEVEEMMAGMDGQGAERGDTCLRVWFQRLLSHYL